MKLSAIRPIFGCKLIQTHCVLWLLLTSLWTQGGPCGPSPEIRSHLERRLWSIEVRCYRRAGRSKKAELLTMMDQLAASLHSGSDPVYWDALATLMRLYGEGNQKDLAAQKLNSMQQFLAAHPDPRRSAQLEALQKLADTPYVFSP